MSVRASWWETVLYCGEDYAGQLVVCGSAALTPESCSGSARISDGAWSPRATGPGLFGGDAQSRWLCRGRSSPSQMTPMGIDEVRQATDTGTKVSLNSPLCQSCQSTKRCTLDLKFLSFVIGQTFIDSMLGITVSGCLASGKL